MTRQQEADQPTAPNHEVPNHEAPKHETGSPAIGKLETGDPETLDLATVRERLSNARGPEYWRSLEELAGSPKFEQLLHREFPRFASEWPQGVSRRSFLELAAASLALAGLTACTRQPAETIVPYVRQPENLVPGRPLHYATAMELSGSAIGLLVESHMARPTKAEGNPDHPASLGATDVFAQASLLDLYDPDRTQVITHLGRVSTWGAFLTDLRARLSALEALGGEGLRILIGTVVSPTLAAQLRAISTRYPQARWHQYEPCGRHAARAAAREAFGEPADVRYDLSQADVVVALDADFLTAGTGWVRHAREFARRRKTYEGEGAAGMNRLYAVESSPTATSAQADHRLALPPSQVALFAAALAAELGVAGAQGVETSTLPEKARRWLPVVAQDLSRHPGRCAVIPGEDAPPEVHVLAHAINAHLGSLGTAVIVSEPVEAEPVDQMASIRELADAMRDGQVDTLLILGGNPVYDAPADCDFAGALQQVARRIHLGLYDDETSQYCHWHLPGLHYLEGWSDTRAFDGTASIVQPLIQPLYGGKSAHELLALLSDSPDATAHELVRAHWQGRGLGGGDFEAAWRQALHDGLIPETAAPAKVVAVDVQAVTRAVSAARNTQGTAPGAYELIFRPDPAVYDGRFANNGWLQELPRPLTKLTWDNAVFMSPKTAEALGVEIESLVRLADAEGREVTGPAWVLPGHAEGCLTLHLGYGRERAGRVGNGAGFSAYPLRTTRFPWTAPGVTATPTGGVYPLASAQTHHDIALQTREAEERHLVRHGTVARFQEDPAFVAQMGHPAPAPDESLYPGFQYDGYAWGLSVDLSSCVGCNACVVACQSENNIPVVGKEQVAAGREMQWIRIDRYYQGELDDPGTHYQPVMCMHCEQAPCEVVCPVGATVHSPEGLNEMVYNRCVGTRYCSNNCPYKVRRFNFLLYSDFETEMLKMVRNPDVTVRSRGVMEKCTYCVQRINLARIDAKREERTIRDGEIQTACQQVCPAEAIVFGDVNDPASRVSRRKASPLDYGLLTDLNTRPRTTYLAKLTNPNPALAGDETEEAHGA